MNFVLISYNYIYVCYFIFQMIKVFVVDLCCLLEYEVTEATPLSEVQKWVVQDSGVAIEDQRPLLPRGQPPDPTRPAIQCWAPPVRIFLLLFYFVRTNDKIHSN